MESVVCGIQEDDRHRGSGIRGRRIAMPNAAWMHAPCRSNGWESIGFMNRLIGIWAVSKSEQCRTSQPDYADCERGGFKNPRSRFPKNLPAWCSLHSSRCLDSSPSMAFAAYLRGKHQFAEGRGRCMSSPLSRASLKSPKKRPARSILRPSGSSSCVLVNSPRSRGRLWNLPSK